MNLRITAIFITTVLIFWSCGSGGGGNDDTATPTPTPLSTGTPGATPTTAPTGRQWTVSEILAEPRTGGFGGTPLCGGEFGFKRCTCPENVRSSIRYRPAVVECNGNAAAILYDEYTDIFSVVVRDTQNRDRWPAAGSGFGGCNFSLANSEAPPNRCSAFKVQDKFSIGGGAAVVYCFGASGYSDIFSDAARLTFKLADAPNSNDDPLERHCLYSGDRPLN